MEEVVAYLGPPASYTHQATLKLFAEAGYVLHSCSTIEEVFKAIQARSASRGVVPFENSTNGAVIATLDLLADSGNQYPNIQVCDEAYLDVHHCLLGHDGALDTHLEQNTATEQRAAPLASLERISTLYSHPQTWGQCRNFISKFFQGVPCLDVASTSRAAEMVAQDTSGRSAAISSSLAADMFGLRVLARDIEDRADNTTRFLVLQISQTASSRASNVEQEHQTAEKLCRKSLVIFEVDHDDPGALAQALAVFKPYQLNLTSINTRPSGGPKWHYIFLAELQGAAEDGGNEAVKAALADLEKVTSSLRWLGSWESQSKG